MPQSTFSSSSSLNDDGGDGGGASSTLGLSGEPSPTSTSLTHSSSSATVRPSSKPRRSPPGPLPTASDPSRLLAPEDAIFSAAAPLSSRMRAASRRELAEPFYTARDGSTTTAVEEPSVADASSTAVAGGEGVASTNGMMSSSSSQQQQQQTGAAAGRIMEHQRRKQRERDRGRSGSRRRGKGAWKKLLWVKQACECDPNTVPAPDHDLDLDQDLFFDLLGLYGRPHLEHTCGSLCAAHVFRNPRLQPYEFWPLVADSTVIVQHVMSVAIWISCFSGIVQERVTPFMVVCAGSASTVLGWLLWDYWVSKEEDAETAAIAAANAVAAAEAAKNDGTPAEDGTSSTSSTSSGAAAGTGTAGLGLLLPNANAPSARNGHSRGGSLASVVSNGSAVSAVSTGHPTGDPTFATAYQPPHGEPMSPRNQRRWATIKSAVLIYCVLLGLSPILKSLTKSTTSDSIWAMTSFLTIINISFFDYGGGVGAK
ncbi:GPI2-domain-containing protein [Neofusicoccum parvum]|nr:GPI2-domain-containing protein [Neofusicoccum parvum]